MNNNDKSSQIILNIKQLISLSFKALGESDLLRLKQLARQIKSNAHTLENVLIQVQVQLLEQAIEQKLYGRINGLLNRISNSLSQAESPTKSHQVNQATKNAISREIKYLGTYLVEAELLTPVQVQIALADQQSTGMRFGDILVARGWMKRGTIEYIMTKVILPERENKTRENLPPDSVESLRFSGHLGFQSPSKSYMSNISDKDTFLA